MSLYCLCSRYTLEDTVSFYHICFGFVGLVFFLNAVVNSCFSMSLSLVNFLFTPLGVMDILCTEMSK